MQVSILNKSFNKYTGDTITSFLLEGFPYDVLAEFNKHRLFSISCESSRARNLEGVLQQVTDDPFVPIFTRKQKGMSGEPLGDQVFAKLRYLMARNCCTDLAIRMDEEHVHKQDINGILKPWMKVSQIVTSTHWDNFYNLRRGEGAKGAIKEFADAMYSLDEQTEPKKLKFGEWHMPYPELSLRENVAKCGSISYANHQKDATKAELITLHDKLIRLRHDVPTEHCAMVIEPGYLLDNQSTIYQVFDHFKRRNTLWYNNLDLNQIDVGNFTGFLQYRKFLENGLDVQKYHPNY